MGLDGLIALRGGSVRRAGLLTCHLSLIQRAPADLRVFVLAQDAVYFGEGNTRNVLALWRE